MKEGDIAASIDKDIAKHHEMASSMMGVVWVVLFIALLVLFIYLAPGLIKSILHIIGKDVVDKNDEPVFAALSVVSRIEVDVGKVEFVFKVLPYFFGATLGGFLYTYRLHVISAKELSIEKIRLLSQSSRDSRPA